MYQKKLLLPQNKTGGEIVETEKFGDIITVSSLKGGIMKYWNLKY